MPLSSCRKPARTALAAVFAVPLLAGACNSPTDGEGVNCTDISVPGIRGTARDANTNADITAGAYLVATEGTYKDSVGPGASILAAAHERAGTYTVRVGHPGYFPRTRTNVVVRADECHVITVTVQENLVPAPGGPN